MLRFVNIVGGRIRGVPTPATYSYADIADRLEQTLGVRPAISTLRAAAAATHRTANLHPRHDRITAAMPAPLTSPAAGEPARFDAGQIEHWIARHPRLLKQRAQQHATQALRRGEAELDVVIEARANGLSWASIATILTSHDHTTRTVPGLSRFYHRRGVN